MLAVLFAGTALPAAPTDSSTPGGVLGATVLVATKRSCRTVARRFRDRLILNILGHRTEGELLSGVGMPDAAPVA